jgi:DNA-binding beta-propeller fold protein YncE
LDELPIQFIHTFESREDDFVRSENSRASNSVIEIESTDLSVQSISPANKLDRFEGIAFSCSGRILGIATSESNTILLFRRKSGNQFEETPYQRLVGPDSKVNYPHDLSFFRSGDVELLAVAQRGGSILLFEKNKSDDLFCSRPVFEIIGRQSKLNFSDGVAFVPPAGNYIAACNATTDKITFYRKSPESTNSFGLKPAFQIKLRSLSTPDGLAFSQCGTWLAVANHGAGTVSIFQRRRSFFSRTKLRYGRRPVTVIKDPTLRYPHSVAFIPRTNHLVVTSAGANYFNIYSPTGFGLKMSWSQLPVSQTVVGPEKIFREINTANKMEGGPKGVDVYNDDLAICSPEHGIKIYSSSKILRVPQDRPMGSVGLEPTTFRV